MHPNYIELVGKAARVAVVLATSYLPLSSLFFLKDGSLAEVCHLTHVIWWY